MKTIATYEPTEEHFDCEWPHCGRPADNEITYRDRDGGEVYWTTRCELHTLLEEAIDAGAMADVRRLAVLA